jgi:hypothetical protein
VSATLINLIIQLIAGAVGGNAAGATMKNLDLGALGNTNWLGRRLGAASRARSSPPSSVSSRMR